MKSIHLLYPPSILTIKSVSVTVGPEGLIRKDQLQQMAVCPVELDGRSSAATTADGCVFCLSGR